MKNLNVSSKPTCLAVRLTGFKLGSLNRIIDTKSSSNSKVTLLNYLATVLEKKVPLNTLVVVVVVVVVVR